MHTYLTVAAMFLLTGKTFPSPQAAKVSIKASDINTSLINQ
jgi:hypothetical protein